MSHAAPAYATLDDWIARDAIPFSIDSSETFTAAAHRMVASLGDSVDLLGLGEALHGGAGILILRNRLFQRLVEAHGFSAIAIESSFPRGPVVDDYIAGRGPASYEAVQEIGFSHGFGQLAANRELIEWMRQYNADPSHRIKLRFYGFDSPTEMTGTDSPRQLLHFALDHFASIDSAAAAGHRQRIDELLGDDAAWENPAALMDPTKSIGLSPAATALRIATEDFMTELQLRRPEFIAKSDEGRFLEAAQHLSVARQLLNYHAGLARASQNRIAELLGIRDVIMADNLAYAVARERGRGGGKVLAFAHNSHLKRGEAQWQLGPHALAWWPAGAHLTSMLGPRYAVIGSAIGISNEHGIAQPEPNTLEARLTAAPGPARLIPTHLGHNLPAAAIAELPTRSGSMTNQTYFSLAAQCFTDFDWLAVLDSTK